MPDGLFLGQVSFSQVSNKCGYALMMSTLVYAHERGEHTEKVRLCRRCQGLPEPAESIAMIFGRAFEAGVQYQVTTHEGAEPALEHARRVLRDELYEAWAKGGVKFDAAAKMTKGWLDKRTGLWKEPPRPHKGSEKLMQSLIEAERNLELGVPAWVNRLGRHLRAKAFQDEFRIPLAGEFEGWFIKCVFDLVTTEGGLIDTKASGSDSWTADDLDEKVAQLHIYNRGFELKHGHRPAYSLFHLLHTGTSKLEVIEVPYDEERIETILEDQVYPWIRAKRDNALVPNQAGWWHTERFCDHWQICPHGAKARGGFVRIELPEVAA